MRQWLTLPEVRFIGRGMGCSCGFECIICDTVFDFYEGMFDYDEDQQDELRSMTELLEYVRAFVAADGEVELFSIWNGEAKAPLGTVERMWSSSTRGRSSSSSSSSIASVAPPPISRPAEPRRSRIDGLAVAAGERDHRRRRRRAADAQARVTLGDQTPRDRVEDLVETGSPTPVDPPCSISGSANHSPITGRWPRRKTCSDISSIASTCSGSAPGRRWCRPVGAGDQDQQWGHARISSSFSLVRNRHRIASRFPD